ACTFLLSACLCTPGWFCKMLGWCTVIFFFPCNLNRPGIVGSI
ncbi:furin (paired basic amino acid cleaving enzyme), isoform CRA_c, partial [Mus musculus]